MAEDKKAPASERRYGSKSAKAEGKGEAEKKDGKEKSDGGGEKKPSMAESHASERGEMAKKHEKERRDIHGKHREEMRDLHTRHEGEVKTMLGRQVEQMSGPMAGAQNGDVDGMGSAVQQQGEGQQVAGQ